MKKVISMVCALALLASCTNEMLPVDEASENPSGVSVVGIENGTVVPVSRDNGNTKLALAFANQQTYDSFISTMEGLSKDARMELIHSHGIVNLYDLASYADEELEFIGSAASSEEEFRTMYAKYVDKYKGLLVTNAADDTDLQLYVPDKENMETYIANFSGQYVINGTVHTADLDLNYSEPQIVQTMATSDEIGDFVNSGTFEPASSKKVEFSIGRKYDTVHITAKFKKHMWYGWKHDPNHEIMFDLALSGANIEWIAVPASRIWVKTKDDFDVDMFRITDNGVLSGMIYIWTDYSFERDADYQVIYETIGNLKYPKVLMSKAVKCKVSLPRPI